MASKTIRNLYQTVRKADVACIVGEHAKVSLHYAKTLAKWNALESLGLVRIVELPDLDCDDYNDAVGVIGQYVRPETVESIYLASDDEYEHADSVWGCAGYRDASDWRENPYVLDIMAATIAAFRDAWKSHVADRSAASAWAKV